VPRPSILFIHGGITGAWIWDAWRAHLSPFGWEVNVLDLRGHGRSLPADMALITMDDYLADVASVAEQVAAARGAYPVIGGWAMGGLIAMLHAAREPRAPGLLLFAPSPPLEVAGRAEAEVVRQTPSGPFGAEVYGLYPDDLEASRQALHDLTDEEAAAVLEQVRGAEESGLARRQRRRGISLAALAGGRRGELPIAGGVRRVGPQLRGGAAPAPGHLPGRGCLAGAADRPLGYRLSRGGRRERRVRRRRLVAAQPERGVGG